MKNQLQDFPFKIQISFHKVIEAYRERAQIEERSIPKQYLDSILEYIKDFPQLENGFEDEAELKTLKQPIKILLDDLFPTILTNNEIKAASIPQHKIVFNCTKRFEAILKEAGDDFNFETRGFNYEYDYVFGCILILNKYYDYQLDFMRPFYYDIPDKDGILKHYRLAVNSDFIDFKPTDTAVDLSEDDIAMLLENTEDVELWKEKFPPLSWVFKGFVILNLTDVTIDDGISDLKTQLLQQSIPSGDDLVALNKIFKSIYKIPDLRIGFTMFEKRMSSMFQMEQGQIRSYILNENKEGDCREVFCKEAYETLVKDLEYMAIPNVKRYAEQNKGNLLAKNLLAEEVNSCILAPIAKGGELLAVLELVSSRKNELNSINAIKLEDILPYIITTVERNRADFENRIKAVIQSECTAIHPSVLWVFEEEAKRYIRGLDADGVSSFRDIAFKDVYPLYGQIDIVGSSEERNDAIKEDLLKQLDLITAIIDKAYSLEALPIYEQIKFRIREFSTDLNEHLNASSEQKIVNFIHREIQPLVSHLKKQSPEVKKMIDKYDEHIDDDAGMIYDSRKDYDQSVQRINRTLARFLDSKQVEAQKIYPHYFERYKTDGVDHNIYIGESMTKDNSFSPVYLYNLRLWQLQTMCEMENKFYHIQRDAPLQLDAASLILVFSSTLSIRYRMDEKKFDVDGTYNARYEIIKKRIDKAYIKDTEERITQKGKIAIVYSQKSDEREYLRYIQYLQEKQYLGEEVELLELEDVQGVVGLRAIRVQVLYHRIDEQPDDQSITYENLMKELF